MTTGHDVRPWRLSLYVRMTMMSLEAVIQAGGRSWGSRELGKGIRGQPGSVRGQGMGQRSTGGQEALMEAGERVHRGHRGWGGEVGQGVGVSRPL